MADVINDSQPKSLAKDLMLNIGCCLDFNILGRCKNASCHYKHQKSLNIRAPHVSQVTLKLNNVITAHLENIREKENANRMNDGQALGGKGQHLAFSSPLGYQLFQKLTVLSSNKQL